MEIKGSIKSIHELEQILTQAFDYLVVKDGGAWLPGGASKTFTRIIELYPDRLNPFQATVWLRFTYCLQDGTAEMKISSRDVKRFMRIIRERNIRLRLNNAKVKDKEET